MLYSCSPPHSASFGVSERKVKHHDLGTKKNFHQSVKTIHEKHTKR